MWGYCKLAVVLILFFAFAALSLFPKLESLTVAEREIYIGDAKTIYDFPLSTKELIARTLNEGDCQVQLVIRSASQQQSAVNFARSLPTTLPCPEPEVQVVIIDKTIIEGQLVNGIPSFTFSSTFKRPT